MSIQAIRKSALLPYAVNDVFNLVERVEEYGQFMPWCSGTSVDRSNTDHVVATVNINYRGIRQSFTTRNQATAPEHIKIALLDGPFTSLQGEWRFTALDAMACKVEFELDYETRSGLLGRALSPVFGHIAGTFIDAFVSEAERRYA